MLPQHGKIQCRKCFDVSTSAITQPHPLWRIVNDPGAWGSATPDYLVLGFSKGATQAGIYQDGDFEEIAFAGMRPRLSQALQAVGVLPRQVSVDEKIRDPNSDIAFGSLIRCSVSRKDEAASAGLAKDVYACTGRLISKSFSEIPNVVKNCANKYLNALPSSIRAVLFLGNTDAYVKNCQRVVRDLFPNDFRRLNSMAVEANGRLWVHLAHPSGLNGHFNNWLESATGAGMKRILAKSALEATVRIDRQHLAG
jgi:hypothetical protein